VIYTYVLCTRQISGLSNYVFQSRVSKVPCQHVTMSCRTLPFRSLHYHSSKCLNNPGNTNSGPPFVLAPSLPLPTLYFPQCNQVGSFEGSSTIRPCLPRLPYLELTLLRGMGSRDGHV
jgi:hypothetical protein